MPHKHKRQKLENGEVFDLPPTSVAKPLPSFQKPSKDANSAAPTQKKRGTALKPGTQPPTETKIKTKTKNKNRNKNKLNADDTPKSFARLMQFHTLGKRLPSGLDDAPTDQKKSKKRKAPNNDTTKSSKNTNPSKAIAPLPPTSSLPSPAPPPQILPGERLSDFAARVDLALPISGLLGTDKQRAVKVPGLKGERITKHNKRLTRMQKEWRAEEERRKEKREEELEELEDEREERGEGDLWNHQGNKKKRKAGGVRLPEGTEKEEEDPWKQLERKRAEAKQRNLQDVVQAPPQLKKVLKSKFKEVGNGVGVDVGNVPAKVGSLRKREEMGEARRQVIEGYRQMMRNERKAQ